MPIFKKEGNQLVEYTQPSQITERVSTLERNTCANLLKPTAQTQTINGVTFTNNGDGTYTVNGTNDGTLSIFVLYYFPFVKKGTYNLTGCPSGGAANKFKMDFEDTTYNPQYNDFGNGNNECIVSSDSTDMIVRIIVYPNTVCNNLLFKPMLTTDLGARYDDYVPYTGDSGRLNEDVSQINSDLSDNMLKTNLLVNHDSINCRKFISEALLVDLTNPYGSANEGGYVEKNRSSDIPNDCMFASREVLYITDHHLIVRLTGLSTSDALKTWLNFYNISNWSGWY